MKKIFAAVVASLFLFAPVANAAQPVIRIVDKPHVNFEGAFRDNELAATLLPNGKLGKLVFSSNSSGNTYVIDAALVDEVSQMAKGYSIAGKQDPGGQKAAQNWLFRLKYAVSNSSVVALPYGNPDEKLLKSLAPSELTFYSQYARERLESFLGRTVVAENGWGKGTSRLSYQFQSDYSHNRKLLTGLSTITSSQEITDLRARLALPMNPLLNKEERTYFSYGANAAVDAISNRLKVIPGAIKSLQVPQNFQLLWSITLKLLQLSAFH